MEILPDKDIQLILSKALGKWGINPNADICIEEMGELIQALIKARRRPRPKDWLKNLYEELADVQLCLWAMIIAFDGESVMETYIKQKAERLEETIEAENNSKEK